MPGITVATVEKSRRTDKQRETASEILTGLLKPFRILELYPPIEEEIEPGRFETRREIQPHQQLLHDGYSITAQKARHILSRADVKGLPPETVIDSRTLAEWKEESTKQARFILLSGGYGSGKSYTMTVEIVRLLRAYPGIKVCAEGNTEVGGVPLGDLIAPERVRTIHGYSSASTPFRRGQADLWSVRTQSGRAISVTEHHRFLTPSGWSPLSDLSVGDLIAVDGRTGGNCDWGISTDFQERCGTGLRRDGELLSPEAVAALHTIRQILALYCRDIYCRLSSSGVGFRVSRPVCKSELGCPLSEEFAGYWQQTGRQPFQWPGFPLLLDSGGRSLLREAACGVAGLPNHLYQVVAGLCETLNYSRYCIFGQSLLDRDSVASRIESAAFLLRFCEDLRRALSLSLRREEFLKGALAIRQDNAQPLFDCLLAERLSKLFRMLAWCPPDNQDTPDWSSITSVQYDKFGDYFDISVPQGANYAGNGVFSHNCVSSAFDYYFDESVLPTWNRVLDLDESELVASWNKKERLATLTNGSEVRFHAYDDPMKIKGWEAHVIWIEEASELGDGNNEKALAIFNAFLGRLRASSPKYPLRMYVSQNPRGHNWVWKTFVKSEPHAGAPQPLGDAGRATPMRDRFGNPVWKRDRKGRELEGDPVVFREFEKVTATGDIFYTISTGTHANQYVPPAYVATMLGQYADTPGLRERFVDGMFTPINSLVYEYPIFSKETHCIDYQDFLDVWEVPEIPNWWPVRVGIDCAGLRSPWAIEYYVLAGGIPGGHWVGFDEIYVRGKTYGQIIDLMLDKVDPERGGRRFEDISYWIDPISSQQRNSATSETLETEFRRRGIPVQMPKHYSYYGGIAKIQSFLFRNKEEPNPYLLNETQIESENGDKEWDIGCANLYYLKGMPGKPYYVDGRLMNEDGQAMPANMAEKSVFRMDDRKQREGKESEEGLTPFQTEKVLRDRDDHAQTSEFFALYSLTANDVRTRSLRGKNHEQPGPAILYGQSRRRRVF